jgi:transcription termination/antitermination protein NusA
MLSDLKRIIDQVCKDKGIDRQSLIETLEEAVLSAAQKKFGYRRDLEVNFNEELGEIELFQFQKVVDVVTDEQLEITCEDAQLMEPDIITGDELGSKLNMVDLGRIAAQSAKQIIIQKMKAAERDVIYDLYKDRKGEIVNGIVQRFERGNMIVNLGRTDAILPSSEQMPRRNYRQGDRIRAYLLDVRSSFRDAQLILSRTHNEFLSKLFTIEVPEISEGVVQIMGVTREPGYRAKIAVTSSESDVDPVGACVGMKGSRVQNVVQELQGEKIDIVPWSPDPARFVSNALAPALVSLVVVDEEKKTLLVVVPNDQLSLAIGRQGQNVRLASMLLKWRIDVKSEQKYQKSIEDGFQSLLKLEGIDEKLANRLSEGEIGSIVELSKASVEDIVKIGEIEQEVAEELLAAAKKSQSKKPDTVSENNQAAQETEPGDIKVENEKNSDNTIPEDVNSPASSTEDLMDDMEKKEEPEALLPEAEALVDGENQEGTPPVQ